MSALHFHIRPENLSDIPQIHAITWDAFGRRSEADLTDALRADGALMLSQVAEMNDEIVGHAAYSPVSVSDGDESWRCVALGPIAVAPAFQRRGIGSVLVRAGLRRCGAPATA